MTNIEKIFMGIVAVAMITTLVLPARQTPKVIDSTGNLFKGSLATAMGSTKAA